MCYRQMTEFRGHLSQHAAVQTERFTNPLLGFFNLAIHLVGREVDKSSRQFGQQGFELQLLGKCFFDSLAFSDIENDAR